MDLPLRPDVDGVGVVTLTAVSLFAGVGGFDLAMQANDINVVAAVEIDDAARGVIAHRFPDTQLFTDVCEVTGDQLLRAGFDPANGILTGGFPCQDLSVAGKRAGLDGARSGLFWEICRLIDETQPKWLVLENVPGLLSSAGGRDMGAVVGALVDRGYGIAYRVLDAQHFGVPQRRRRVVIVGCAGDDGRTPCEVLAIGESLHGDSSSRSSTGQEVAGTLGGGTGGRGWSPDTDRMTFVPVVNRMTAFGQYETDGTFSTVKARDYKDATDLVTYVKAKRAQSADDDESWREDTITPTLNGFDTGDTRATTVAVQPISFYSTGGGNDAPATGISPALKVGSSLDIASPPAVAYGLDEEQNGALELMGTLKARKESGGHQFAVATFPASTVRRLTPLECERLQGFPDGWTAERYDYKKQQVVPQADSARYKQMGNAVAVPVFAWVMGRLAVAHANALPANEEGAA